MGNIFLKARKHHCEFDATSVMPDWQLCLIVRDLRVSLFEQSFYSQIRFFAQVDACQNTAARQTQITSILNLGISHILLAGFRLCSAKRANPSRGNEASEYTYPLGVLTADDQ